MASNFICWLCGVNHAWKDYKETELLDEDGSKPCFECYLEHEEEKEQQKEVE